MIKVAFDAKRICFYFNAYRIRKSVCSYSCVGVGVGEGEGEKSSKIKAKSSEQQRGLVRHRIVSASSCFIWFVTKVNWARPLNFDREFDYVSCTKTFMKDNTEMFRRQNSISCITRKTTLKKICPIDMNNKKKKQQVKTKMKTTKTWITLEYFVYLHALELKTNPFARVVFTKSEL